MTSSNEQRKYSAFVSYAAADREAAERIVSLIESKGLTCWIAPRDVRPGAEYAVEIMRGIEQSNCFVLVLSDAANMSNHVRREVERAASKGKAIYPVRIQNIQPSAKLEYFIAMHHWLDAWDGVLDSHVDRLIAAMNSDEEWIGNVVMQRRRRRMISSGVAGAFGVLVLAGAVVFGTDIRGLFLDDRERARKDLQALNIPFNADGLSLVLASADEERLNLFTRAGISPGDIKSAFGRDGIARQFFENSRTRPDAISWFRDVLASQFDPNMVTPHSYYGSEGILAKALSAGNLDASLALLDAGASPHVYQDLWFTWHSKPRSVYPYDYIDEYSGFDAGEKAELAVAFAEAGAVLSIPESGDTYAAQQAIELRDKIKARFDVDVPHQSSICEASDTRICLEASRRTGFDWCAFARALPKQLYSSKSDYYEFNNIELVNLVNVVDDQAYVLGNAFGGYRPGNVWIEISKDMSNWSVYKYTSPAAGMGHCKKDDNDYVRDDCWRRVTFEKTDDDDILKMLNYYDYTKEAC